MKQWKGCIIEESLENKEVLEDVKIISTEAENAIDAAATQPKIFHLYYVLVDDERIDSVSQKINKSLKSEQPWYVDFRAVDEAIVIFKNRIFRIRKSDKEGINKIKKYGISLGIPERQLSFDKNWK